LDDISNYDLRLLGRVIGETSHTVVLFTANRPPRVGEYVLIEYDNEDFALGIVEMSRIGNPLLTNRMLRPEVISRAESFGVEKHEYMIGQARLLSWLSTLIRERRVEAPRYPPKPMARVFEASGKVLRKIFSLNSDGAWIRLGVLANHPDVPFYVNINTIISRHLAILAITGAGKSNTVAVLTRRIVDELGGTVLIIDMHSEYEGVANNVNIVKPKINPSKLTLYEYYRLLNLEPKASKQRLYFRRAYTFAKYVTLKRPEEFFDVLISELELYVDKGKYREVRNGKIVSIEFSSRDRSPVIDLLNKLYDLRDRYWGTILTPTAPMELTSVIKPGYANVVQLGSFDEEVADVITSHYLRRVLDERKRFRISGGSEGYPVALLTVIEEAHILVPKDRSTLTKEIVSRIAREGRKFGVGLCLVSQRPKNVDDNALSQTNNKIILRLVEPSDQRYVQAASETLSDELLGLLPSLNVGEAVVLGLMTPLPAVVKIDRAKGKIEGGDVKALEEWRRWRNRSDRDLYDDLGI